MTAESENWTTDLTALGISRELYDVNALFTLWPRRKT